MLSERHFEQINKYIPSVVGGLSESVGGLVAVVGISKMCKKQGTLFISRFVEGSRLSWFEQVVG